MITSPDDIYFFRSLLLNEISRYEDNKRLYANTTEGLERWETQRGLFFNGQRLSSAEVLEELKALFSKYDDLCKPLNLHPNNKQIVPLLAKYALLYRVNYLPNSSADNEIYLYRNLCGLLITTYEKTKGMAKIKWDRAPANADNAFGRMGTPEEGLKFLQNKFKFLHAACMSTPLVALDKDEYMAWLMKEVSDSLRGQPSSYQKLGLP